MLTSKPIWVLTTHRKGPIAMNFSAIREKIVDTYIYI